MIVRPAVAADFEALVVLDMSAANRDALAFYHELGYREFGLFLGREVGRGDD